MLRKLKSLKEDKTYLIDSITCEGIRSYGLCRLRCVKQEGVAVRVVLSDILGNNEEIRWMYEECQASIVEELSNQ